MSRASIFLMTIMFSLAMGAPSPSPSPSPSSASVDCSSAILGLADCLPFVQEGSTTAKPQKSCCSGLKSVVKQDASCLCEAFKQSATFGISLNTTKALGLPSVCGVSTPPLSKCHFAVAVGGPGTAPAPAKMGGAPAASPSSTQSHSMAPVPSPSVGHSGSSAAPTTAPPAVLLIGAALAALSSYL